MTSKRSICIAALCGLALVGAGCGDDEENGALSYEETSAEVNEICASLEDVGEGLTRDPEKDAPILAEAAPKFEDAVDKLRDLEVAEELASPRDDLVANAQAQLDLLERAQTEAEAGDRKAYRTTLQETEPLDKESNEIGNELGAQECVED